MQFAQQICYLKSYLVEIQGNEWSDELSRPLCIIKIHEFNYKV